MLIEPGFVDHWKVELLRKLTGDERAIEAVLRLWEFCQERKTDALPHSVDAIASICKMQCTPEVMMDALLKTFVEEDADGNWFAHDWADTNRSLYQKWEAGKHGGRPRKRPAPPSGSNSDTPGTPDAAKLEPPAPPRPARPAKDRPETLEAVKAYGAEIGLSASDAEHFFDYYTGNGWRVGRNAMKDWRAAVRNWKRNKSQYANGTSTHQQSAPGSQHARATFQHDESDIERLTRVGATFEAIRDSNDKRP